MKTHNIPRILFLMIMAGTLLFSGCSKPADTVIEPSQAVVSSIPTESAVITPTPQPSVTPALTPAPTKTPIIHIGGPDMIGFYTRGSSRRLIKEFKGPWIRGKDIYIFDVYATHKEVLEPASHAELFESYWHKYPKADEFKIGYCIDITLKSGEVIHMTIRLPKDAPKDPKAYFYQFVEVYTYDNIHKKAGVKFYHLEEHTTYQYTLMTSIKLTPGIKIAEVEKIKLATFVYKDDSDFDPVTGDYIGLVRYEIPVVKSN